jgi:hypothetical protein
MDTKNIIEKKSLEWYFRKMQVFLSFPPPSLIKYTILQSKALKHENSYPQLSEFVNSHQVFGIHLKNDLS